MERNRQNWVSEPAWGTIKGTLQIVRNAYGEDEVFTLCCIKVTLLDVNNQWVAEESTDDNGDFAFTGVALNAYTVVFPKSIDYQKQRFMPEGKDFQRKLPVTLTAQQALVKGVVIRYAVPEAGALQDAAPDTDVEEMSESQIA